MSISPNKIVGLVSGGYSAVTQKCPGWVDKQKRKCDNFTILKGEL